MDIGYFTALVPAGPMRLFGERVVIKPDGFESGVDIGLYRVSEGWTACHFQTGKSFQIIGKRRRDAIDSASEQLVMMKPAGLEIFIKEAEVLNEAIEPAYKV